MSLISTLIPDRRKFIKYLLILISGLLVVFVCCDKLIMPAIVSSSKTIKVPNVSGLPKQQAIDILEGQGLKVQEVMEQFNEKVPSGTVYMQSPYSNALVKEGRRVYLTVSKGYEVVTMPDLTMMTQRDAQVALMRLGLSLGNVSYDWKDSIPENRIIRQSYNPGMTVATGASINIVLSKDSTNSIVLPSFERLTQDEAMSSITQQGLVVGEIVQEPNETYTPGTVLRQSPNAGVRVKLSSTVNLWVASQE
ncbi:MAG: PASTA domain-containing protein [Candidatus Kapaibacterium sp.]